MRPTISPPKAYSIPYGNMRAIQKKELAWLQSDIVQSCANILVGTLTSAGWSLSSSDSKEEELFERLLSVDGFVESIEHLSQVMLTRFAIIEIVWGKGYFPTLLRPIPHELITLDFREGFEPKILIFLGSKQEELKPLQYIFLRYRPTIQHPEGISILESVEELLRAREEIDKTLQKYAERFGAPLVLGRYDPSLAEEERQAILRSLKQIQSASVAIVPGTEQNVGVEILEPKGSGSAEILVEVQREYDRRIARALLGPILPLFEAQFGTRAQAQVHYDILQNIIRHYQSLIESAINMHLWIPLCGIQLGREPQGALLLNEPHLIELDKLAQWISNLVQVGVLDPVQDADYIRRLLNLPKES